jgi:hypothetical protein
MQELNPGGHSPLLRKVSQGECQIISRAAVSLVEDHVSRIECGQQGVGVYCSLI